MRLRTRGKGEEEKVGLILMFRKKHGGGGGGLRACSGIGCKYSSWHPISKASKPQHLEFKFPGASSSIQSLSPFFCPVYFSLTSVTLQQSWRFGYFCLRTLLLGTHFGPAWSSRSPLPASAFTSAVRPLNLPKQPLDWLSHTHTRAQQ